MIPIAKPLVGDEEAEAASVAIRSGWLSQGAGVQAFEREFAALVGSQHATAVSNCTTALHLALLAAGAGPGTEVITVSHTFIACANAIRQCGAEPVFVDIDPQTFNMDPDAIERAIGPKTVAIMPVHQMGMPADLSRILPIARQHRLHVIEDAACAIGSQIRIDGKWSQVGVPHGDAACFSLHPRKVITVGDGGMITTSNAAWDERFRLLRQHGMSVSDVVRHSSNQVVFESYPVVGYNYRMTDVQAAIGREQLKRLAGIIERRRRIADEYRQMLAAEVPDVVTPFEPEWAKSNWQSYCIRLPDGVGQRQVMQRMLDGGIATRRGIMCIHRERSYATLTLRTPLPHSEQAQDRCLLLPLFAQMRADEQERVVAGLKDAVNAELGRSSRIASAAE